MADPDVKHEQYDEFYDVWKRCRDASEGQRAIRKGGELYLPKLIGQTAEDYKKYVERANFFNATGRTLEAMSGLVFRKPMTVEVPAAMLPWLDDITLSGETLTDFSETCVTETMEVARGGIFVDMAKAAFGLTQAQAEALNIRPYTVWYETESIINWEMKRVNNVYKLYNVWLDELFKNDKGEQEQQIRQLTLENGYYEQRVWQKGEANVNWFIAETIIPTKSNTPFTEIPFYPLAPRKPTMDVVPPPIEGLVDVNIAHYQNSADLENGAHIAGQPTPYATGMDADQGDIYIGSSTFLQFTNSETQVGFLQCGSEGFATLEKLMDRKEAQMAALGARMLAPEKSGVEAAQTHEIKRGGESSVLSATCGVVERQIEKALTFAANWVGITGTISVELNRDFFPPSFTGQDLTAWVAARQAGEISKEQFFYVIQQAEWVPSERTFEEEQEAIASDGPTLAEMSLNAKTAPTANDNKS